MKKEIERRKKLGNAVGSTPNLTRGGSAAMSRSVTDNMGTGRSVPSLSNSGDDQLLREVIFMIFLFYLFAFFHKSLTFWIRDHWKAYLGIPSATT